MAREQSKASARLLHSAAAWMEACGRNMARASRKLRGGGGGDRPRFVADAKIAPSWAPYLSRRAGAVSSVVCCGIKRGDAHGGTTKGEDPSVSSTSGDEEEEEEEEAGVWRKTILMGVKCQPLDFSGVIYYDSHGRQLPGPPPPRSPPVGIGTPLAGFAYPVVVSARRRGIDRRLRRGSQNRA